jgi:hypothetical protein
MGINPQKGPLDAKQISQFLTNMKKQMAQVDGEISMMKNDAMGSLFQNFANMMNQVWTQKETAEHKVLEAHATLEKIYQGHPDIQIQIEKEAEETKKEISRKAKKV